MIRRSVLALSAGYAVGSIPFGLLIGRFARGRDVRDTGSGSMGTTNVARLAGPAAGAATFALDIGKGAAAVGIARSLGCPREVQAAAGVSAMVGHSWPAFAGFRGGKSVATAFGGLLMLSPASAACSVVGGCTALGLTRVVSIGSLSAAVSATAGGGWQAHRRGDTLPLLFAGAASTLIAVRHRENLIRIARGREPRLGSKPAG